jgi:hypothetical protein
MFGSMRFVEKETASSKEAQGWAAGIASLTLKNNVLSSSVVVNDFSASAPSSQ